MWFNILKIIFIFRAASVVLAAEQKPTPLYRTVADKSYHFSEEKLNWFDAEKKCRESNGSLAAFKKNSDQQSISDFMIFHFSIHPSLLRNWWVAGNDRNSPGNFTWLENGTFVKFVKWVHGQPDNYQGIEHCLQLKFEAVKIENSTAADISYAMSDRDCNQTANYICERAPVVQPSHRKRTGFYQRVGDRWYHFSEKKLNRLKAEQKCRTLNGSLATFETKYEQQTLSKYMIQNFPDKSFLDRMWRLAGNFTKPNKNGTVVEMCQNLVYNTDRKEYMLKFNDCRKRVRYICESAASVALAVQQTRIGPYQQVGNRLLHFSKEKLNQFDAEKKCREFNVSLAVIKNFSDLDTISDYMLENSPQKSSFDSSWWLAGDGTENKNCLSLMYDANGKYYRFDFNACTEQEHFICERVAPVPQPSQRSNFDLYKPVGDRWYHFSNEQLNWAEAYNKCLTIGGYLASLDRRFDQQTVSQHMVNSFPTDHCLLKYWWTSGTDLYSPRRFTWYDKDIPVYFANWADKQPDNYYGQEEHCLHLKYVEHKYVMNNWDCSQRANYICEWYGMDV